MDNCTEMMDSINGFFLMGWGLIIIIACGLIIFKD